MHHYPWTEDQVAISTLTLRGSNNFVAGYKIV